MTAILEILANEKEPDMEQAVKSALADQAIMGEILKGLESKNETYRYNCARVLFRISEDQPQVLYPQWDYFVELLGSKNAYHRMASLEIIANLTAADSEKQFEGLFDCYFGLLDDTSMIVAIYCARNAGTIAVAKPRLKTEVIERLLAIDRTHHREDRKDLIKCDVIQSLEGLFEESDAQERVLAFAEAQLECSSPKTRKAAKG
ncbi:MAG: hypothetical protein SVM79_09500, partial [Chloroflexota bacterium]|nr:hypothetical protein [Chloroflexota bacterium]